MRKLVAIIAAAAFMVGLTSAFATPAQAASPAILKVSNMAPVIGGGQNVTLYGTNLNLVTSMKVDASPATIVSKSATSLVFITPAHAEGRVGITLVHAGGQYVLSDCMVYKAISRRALAPLPYIPGSLKVGKTLTLTPGASTWALKVSTSTPKICSVTGIQVKGLRKGTCLLDLSLTVDSMDPSWRSRSGMYDLTIN
jgi:hypothetical protein